MKVNNKTQNAGTSGQEAASSKQKSAAFASWLRRAKEVIRLRPTGYAATRRAEFRIADCGFQKKQKTEILLWERLPRPACPGRSPGELACSELVEGQPRFE